MEDNEGVKDLEPKITRTLISPISPAADGINMFLF